MKLLYFFSLTLLFFSCTEAEPAIDIIEIEQPTNCDCNDLILDDKYNRFYLTDKKKPFSGQCIVLYQNGNKKLERNYIEGKYHGDVIDYYDNGQIEMIREYKNHFINGFEKIYSKSGQLIKHTIYKQSTVMEVLENHPEISKNN